MPDAFVILFFVIVGASFLTLFIRPGEFNYKIITDANGEQRQVIDADSFHYSTDHPVGVALFDGSAESTGMMNYAFDGLVSGDKWGSAVGVVAFILIVGGAFGIVMKTGAIHNGIMALITKTQHLAAMVLPIMFVLFSLGGAIFGMGEEAIAFCIVLLPLIVALGYDSITAVLITYVATQIGFATSWMNPFSIAIAQGIADIPLMSGQGYRMTMWAVFTAIGLGITLRYARQIKRNPMRSLAYESDQRYHGKNASPVHHYTHTDTLILLIFISSIIWVIWGVTTHSYYIPQIASQFFVMGILAGALACISRRMRINDVSQAFVDGARDLLPAALIVGMAKGIVLVLGGDDTNAPSVLNTLLHYTSNALADTGATTSALLMLLFQSVFNFFVASGSGQAAITMPLMAPLSDLVGVSRQVSVLAFQLGDGLTNLIIPTSASLIGCLGVARIDWSVWVRFVWKWVLLLFMLACAFIVLAVFIELN
jgi:uncharacterized ion transporter superfamily protein YfcC